jgi:hypothetical protein
MTFILGKKEDVRNLAGDTTMYNTKKISFYKKLGIFGLVVLILLTGLGIGYTIGNSKGKATAQSKPAATQTSKAQEDSEILTDAYVEEFLVAYYTKKDLGENQNRYQPYMTTSMFTQAKNEEEEPVNQAYKGYTVNQVYSKGDIYIDQETYVVIAEVSYRNTQRAKRGTDEGALLDQTSTDTLQISFQKVGKKFLVNQINRVTLMKPGSTNSNSYRDVEIDDSSRAFIQSEQETSETVVQSTDGTTVDSTKETTHTTTSEKEQLNEGGKTHESSENK